MIYPMSDKQRAFIESLCAELGHDGEAAEFFEKMPSSKDASAKIDALLAERKFARAHKAPERAPVTMPEPGYYALAVDDAVRFYVVREGKGRWEGRVFLNRYHSDYTDRVPYAEQKLVVDAILADPDNARMTFARELTRCWRCGRMLTDAVSRGRGVGPECAAILGMGVGGVPKPVPAGAPVVDLEGGGLPWLAG